MKTKLKRLIEPLKRKYVAWQINTGRRPRGRSAQVEGLVPGMGMANLVVDNELSARHYIAAEDRWVDLGVISRHRKFTTAGRDSIIDAFTGTFTLSNFNYHDCGTGTTAEANTDTGLVTPAGTARVLGTQSQPTSDKYQTQATISFTSALAITEHGIFSAATAGLLLDRTVFAAINVANGDSIQFTFTLSIAAEP